MDVRDPLVSVIMANFNYARFLDEAIQSVLSQDYGNIELIVVDDGSTDQSESIIRSYGDRVKLIAKPNGGQCSAFNAGFLASKGEIICFADSDDVQYPQKVSTLVQLFAMNPGVCWIQHQLETTNEQLKPDGLRVPLLSAEGLVCPDPHAYLERIVYFITSGLAVRRNVLDRLLPFPDLDLESADEYDRAVHLHNADAHLTALMGTVGPCPGYLLGEILGAYRRHRPIIDVADLTETLRAHLRVEIGASRVWSTPMGVKRTASTAWKHRMIVKYLDGSARFSAARIADFYSGVLQLAPFALGHTKIALRQMLALAYAFALPGQWMKRFIRRTGTGAGN
jgi:glycosyltransferase involved in cell wall biosynthesis